MRVQEIPATNTVPEACKILNTGRKGLYELLACGELDSYIRGKKRLITGDSIARHLERHMQAGYAPIMDSPYRPPRSRRAKRSAKK
jgi:excisionase family DNA binding protein